MSYRGERPRLVVLVKLGGSRALLRPEGPVGADQLPGRGSPGGRVGGVRAVPAAHAGGLRVDHPRHVPLHFLQEGGWGRDEEGVREGSRRGSIGGQKGEIFGSTRRCMVHPLVKTARSLFVRSSGVPSRTTMWPHAGGGRPGFSSLAPFPGRGGGCNSAGGPQTFDRGAPWCSIAPREHQTTSEDV
eukprot:1192731-Prorocentrum_minimum.AAC.2